MNSTISNTQSFTMEEISKRKKELREQLNSQKSIITSSIKDIFSPPAPTSPGELFMRNINTGIAIYDGVMTGIKIMRKIKLFIRKMK